MIESIRGTCDAARMCSHLLDRCGDGGKGFKDLYTAAIDSDGERFLGVVYKMSEKDNGMMLNVCPFCSGKPGYFKRAKAQL